MTLRCVTLLTACSLLGCASPQAPTVLADIQPALDCPEPIPATVPAELTSPLSLPAPELVPRGTGDYGITREQVERIIDLLRAAGERLDQWRAWTP